MRREFYSNGKLLLTGEYAVLDGARALAIPTKYGQSLTIQENDSGYLQWKSFEHQQRCWFEVKFSMPELNLISYSDQKTANTLQNILLAVRRINREFLTYESGLAITTSLTFPKNWGLGTSSTLINNIASWALVDPYVLLEQTFGGSGYDLACAKHDKPIVYQLNDGKATIQEINFNPSFDEHLYFVYLNKKQNSREAIRNYREQAFDRLELVNAISVLTNNLIEVKTLSEFEILLQEHESMLSKVLRITAVQENLFSDYFGVVKSLGGWGGDFVLATGNEKTPEYFKFKGFEVVIPYKNMTL
ncbi:GYDIA family GHMP kinase [Croceitalea rosinachiae]|uniref:GYDIA family GHMP kinase n=1 Tax=Croceitalea rosinachiae TaxID=3075596 RepID=A0ABU3A9W2_9FLAO|nr:GYDIA family GHMP kinase [Croceitalea sp. F388]MDT0606749.1 GYDIA family GHMP kinase [Croceitalea sp. F388]